MKHIGHRVAGLVALALWTVCSGTASAGPRDHEDGLLLRLSGGVGHADADAGGVKLSGTSGGVNFALGSVITPNFALHATLLEWSVQDPDAKMADTTTRIDGRMSMTGVAAGMTYYFMPHNFYLSPSLGIGRLDFESAHTDLGLITDVTLGKEWWTGPNWGLGIAAGAGYHSFHDGDVDDNWSGITYAVRFSATLN